MDDITVRRALRAHVADAPPLRLTSAGVIAAGRRARRLRLAGVAVAAPVAVGGLLVAAVMTGTVLFGRDNAPVMAAPDAATCTALRASPARADIGTVEEAADRLTCYLLDAVPRAFPEGTRFDNNAARPGTRALVAAPADGQGDQMVTATATVTDGQGAGALVVSVYRDRSFSVARAVEECSAPRAKVRCRTGPQGEHIEVYDFGKDRNGLHDRSIRLYIGHTVISIAVQNAPESRSNDGMPARPEPPLTIDQMATLASSPELHFYP